MIDLTFYLTCYLAIGFLVWGILRYERGESEPRRSIGLVFFVVLWPVVVTAVLLAGAAVIIERRDR